MSQKPGAEEERLRRADEFLVQVEKLLLGREGAEPEELHVLVRPLAAALRDVLRMAADQSGHRMSGPERGRLPNVVGVREGDPECWSG
ncbi:hypothetical protein I5Q34_13740 [Streptomyces sp. AV19]|uniref:hypothetical protein n=1 Tax=Streptomyces sp. AV19 TaxID=2793068 RepID=UPI0018FEBB1A|nr:hypothetical protein [Streptomyces sp. AV19]MBH1935322.1 hypothetical protein [Streptomyces sp. AV19]MDG4531207.1 hypothetical protein [Streptomyces sp. AV19]